MGGRVLERKMHLCRAFKWLPHKHCKQSRLENSQLFVGLACLILPLGPSRSLRPKCHRTRPRSALPRPHSHRTPPPTHCLQVIQADIQVGKSYIHAINRVLVPGTEGIRH